MNIRSIAIVTALATLAAACSGSSEPPAPAPAVTSAPSQASAVPAAEAGFSPNEKLAPAVDIPLVEGLTIVTAINSAPGDYESIKRVDTASDASIRFTYSAEHPSSGGNTSRTRSKRVVRRADLASARTYRQGFSNNDDDVYPGATALGVSALVLNELKTSGSSTIKIMPGGLQGMINNALGGLFTDDEDLALVEGTLKRAGTAGVPVIVNDQPMVLPGVQARGRFGDEDAEFVFLDSGENPIALRWRMGSEALQVVKISFPASAPAAKAIGDELQTNGRVDIHGIYFDFGSAVLRAESDAALQQIADALGAHSALRVRLDGHTDNIGTAERNQALSEARARAVRDALVSRFGVAGDRLTTAGFGATQPKAPNDTLVGRARNRRVELVRTGATPE